MKKTKISKTTGKPTRKYTRRTTVKNPGRLTKSSPDLMGALSKAQHQAQDKTHTASEIADCIETEAKKLQSIADILRGKV